MIAEKNYSTVLGIIASLIWASAVAVSGALASSFGPIMACGLECLFAGIILIIIHIIRGELKTVLSHPLKYYLICGFFWFGNVSLFWLAIGAAQSQPQLVVVGACNYLWPVLTLLGSVIILKREANWLLLPGVIISVVGVMGTRISLSETSELMRLSGFFQILSENFVAYGLAIACAISWALYSNLTRPLNPHQKTGGVPLFMLATGFIMLSVSLLVEEKLDWNNKDLALLICWSLMQGLAYLFWDIGMKSGRIVTISTFSMLIPFFSSVITCVLGNLPLTLPLLSASGLIVLGSFICRKAVKD